MFPAKTSFDYSPFDKVMVEVIDKNTNHVVFVGGIKQSAKFIGTSHQNVNHAIKRAGVIKKKYFVKYQSINNAKVDTI